MNDLGRIDWCGKYKRKFYVSFMKCKKFIFHVVKFEQFSVFKMTLESD